MASNPQNWRLILQAAHALTAAGQAPFTRISIYHWIWRATRGPSMTGPVSTLLSRA